MGISPLWANHHHHRARDVPTTMMSAPSTSAASSSQDPGAGSSLYTPSSGSTEQRTDEFHFVRGSEYDEDDEFLDLADTVADTTSNGSTSVTPSVHRFEFAYGRRYHGYKCGRYPWPNDHFEQEIEALKHHWMTELTDGQFWLADIGPSPQKIIDIGTGSGIWAIDVADHYQSAHVVGTDLSPIQPQWLPVNFRTFIDDCEREQWPHGSGYDLAHFRDVFPMLRNVEHVLTQVFQNLRIGGYVEFQDVLPHIHCDDGTMGDNDALEQFMQLGIRAMQTLGCRLFGATDIKDVLEAAGFENVQVVSIKVPVGTWAREPKLKSSGLVMKAMLDDVLEGFAAKPFAALGILGDERDQLLSAARASMKDPRPHRYMVTRFCYGKKGTDVVKMDSDWESAL